MIGALVAPTGGVIVVDGERVASAPPPGVGYVFPKDAVFPWRTVERNIALTGRSWARTSTAHGSTSSAGRRPR